MAESIEHKIQHILKEESSPSKLANILLIQWQRGNLKDEEVDHVAFFLLHSGLFSFLLSTGVKALTDDKYVPWIPMALAILEGLEDPEDAKLYLKHLIEEAEKREQIEALAPVVQLNRVDVRFTDLYQNLLNKRQDKYLEKKEAFKQDLEVAQVQQFIEQEKQILDRWEQFFPGDEEAQKERDLHRQRWARKVLSEKSHQKKWTDSNNDAIKQSMDESPALETLYDDMIKKLEHLKESKEHTKQLTLLLEFTTMLEQMGQPDRALTLLEKFPPNGDVCRDNPSYDWLLVELYLKSQREVDALAHLQELESRYADDPETVFAVSYARAKAMIGLKQNNKAIAILDTIVRLRPDYRDAQYWLSQITGNLR